MSKRSGFNSIPGKMSNNSARSISSYIKTPCKYLGEQRQCEIDLHTTCPPQGSLTFRCPIDSFEPQTKCRLNTK